MPVCMLYTNLKEDQIPGDLETSLAQAVAKVLDKPIERLTVIITPGLRMYRLQSTAPSCFLQIHSIGVFDKERNPTYTQPLIDFFTSQLNLPEERIVIQYLPLELYNVGQVIPLSK